MKTIWKFQVDVVDRPVVKMPAGSKILPHVVAVSPDRLWLWAEVLPDSPNEDRLLCIVGTGNPVPADVWRHVGSVVAGPFVWHVYEVTP